MNIIEQFIKGKNINQEKCEDIIFFNEHYAAIIDGATTKSEHSFNGNSTGKQISILIHDALTKLDKKADKKETADFITNIIYQFYIENDYLKEIEKNSKHKFAASVIIYSRHHSEIWQFGDCHCLIDNTYYESNKHIDYITSSARSLIIGSLLAKGHTVEELLEQDLSREFIQPLLDNQRGYQNLKSSDSEYAYVCFDGFDIPIKDVPTIKIPEETKHIVLASDGYPKLFNTLKDSENYLQYLKKEDPLCYRTYPSTKGFANNLNSFDDRSYLSFYI
jgi:glycerophosphoryl diester phosphodiesterase